MGYNNYGVGGYGNNVGGFGHNACGNYYGGDSFALIVVLFILLIIVGATFYC
ncbi:YjcZ family sporulation protein [Virgibacillus xinjiangensis]|uniref:YjcZ family sporulation protein n=1 Tax=Virgibacillus xinjiangensis TaxID=393090 RepID=A0ABV7CTX3_9BACI